MCHHTVCTDNLFFKNFPKATRHPSPSQRSLTHSTHLPIAWHKFWIPHRLLWYTYSNTLSEWQAMAGCKTLINRRQDRQAGSCNGLIRWNKRKTCCQLIFGCAVTKDRVERRDCGILVLCTMYQALTTGRISSTARMAWIVRCHALYSIHARVLKHVGIFNARAYITLGCVRAFKCGAACMARSGNCLLSNN